MELPYEASKRLIRGDCLEEMRKMADGSVDVVFTSPPYNDSGKTQRDIEKKRHIKYQDVEYRENWYEWQCECIDEMIRVTKRMVMYNVQMILSNKEDVYRLIGHYADRIHMILVWYKPNAQPQPYAHRISNSYEVVLLLRCREFDSLHINSPFYRNVIVKNINSDHKYSDKHRALMSMDFAEEIIREFTFPKETVLDPYMGLGTTGIACIRQNRNFVGIEISEEYYKLAEERIQEETAQISLFNFDGFSGDSMDER